MYYIQQLFGGLQQNALQDVVEIAVMLQDDKPRITL